MTRGITLLVTTVLVLGLVAGLPVASAEEVTTVDDDTQLDDPEVISEYEETGLAEADVPGLDMSIAVSEDQREVGIDAYTAGALHTYVRVDYREEIDRTVRFYVPAEYIEPRRKDNLQAKNTETTAMVEPVAGGEYMAITVQFRGETDAVFAFNDAFGSYLRTTETAYDTVENVTGFSPPRLGAREHEQWQYPPDAALAGDNATYHIPTDPEGNASASDMTIQYDNQPGAEESAWMTMPDCEQTVEPVCVTERDGEPVLFSTSSESVPPIRYKYSRDRKAETKGAVEELKDSWSGLLDRAGGLWGGIAG